MTFDDGQDTGPPNEGGGPEVAAETATNTTATADAKDVSDPTLWPPAARASQPRMPNPWLARLSEWGFGDPVPVPPVNLVPVPVNGEIDYRDRRYAEGALNSEAFDLARTTTGRNDRLNAAAYKLAGFINAGALSESEVVNALTDAGRVCSSLSDHPLTDEEIYSTIRSALRAGRDKGLLRAAPDDASVTEVARGALGVVAGPPSGTDDQARRPWQPIDLDPVLSGEWKPPTASVGRRSDGIGMLYPGKLHTIASESEAGKTWLALAATAEELRQGTSVLYIDFEDDEGGVVGRLLALQVDPKMIRQNFHYVRPTEALGGGMNLLDLQSLILQHCPAIVVIDGITEAMTMHGLDPSNNKDIATFGRILPRRLADAGPAVVCLDHVPKAPDTRGRYAIGGVHKLNGLDGAAFILENREPFGIGLTGRSTILIAKDRPGQLRKHAQRRKDGLHIFGELVLTSHDISYTESEIRPVTGNAEEFLPTTLMTKISDALSEHGPMAQRQILATVKGKRQYAIDALALLQRDGYVSDKSPHELLKAYPDGGAS